MPNRFSLDEIEEHYSLYDIQEYVDSGGFKDVFRGEGDDGDIVLKLFPVESRQMLRRAEREARAMEEVDSAVLVDIIEHFVDEIDGQTTYVIVEEYIPGDTLEQKIKDGEYGLETGLNVTESILTALEEFSKQDLIHRDIKPQNIIITPEDDIVLLDVGIVRFQEEDSLTPDHANRGPSTPPYAAPEVLDNNKDAQDVRTDIFSTGIVLYESITGQHPYDMRGMTRPEAIEKGARKKDLDTYIDDSELGNQINDIYLKMTENQQHKRYRKPEFALEELDIILKEEYNV